MDKKTFGNLSDMLDNTSNKRNTGFSDNINNSDFFKNIMSNFSSNNNDDGNININNNNFDFSNIDMETIGKIGKIMSKMNSNASNPRSNLLLSLKPYLKPSRRNKVDKYIQFINMTSIIEDLNKTGGEN